MKLSNNWHASLYDIFSARVGLDSTEMHQKAEKEVRFLIRALNLTPPAKCLDVACGTGRHARVLANLGFDVTGVDINTACLALARRNCARSVCLKRGDMKDLSWARGRFDAVINMSTSFGYFSNDRENEYVLRQMVRSLKPGGKIAIQTINRDFVLSIFDPARRSETETYREQETTKYDSKTKYIETEKIIIEKSSRRKHRYYFRVRLYSVPELKALMRRCGVREVQAFGSADGEKVDRLKSSHPLYVGAR